MPEITVFPLRVTAPGYSAHDCALQDLLFGSALNDETPDGPSRTWIYREGPAEDVGCFEPATNGSDPEIDRQPDAAVALIRIEPPAARNPQRRRRAASHSGADGWPAKHF